MMRGGEGSHDGEAVQGQNQRRYPGLGAGLDAVRAAGRAVRCAECGVCAGTGRLDGASNGSTGFLGAETNQWYPDLVYDNHTVDQPKMPEDGYHLTDDITDKALEFIRDAKVLAPDKPFFLYYAPGACHAPHHAPKEWIEKFRGQFDMGYEEIRDQSIFATSRGGGGTPLVLTGGIPVV
jgi:arylsulfatase A-like enzyme